MVSALLSVTNRPCTVEVLPPLAVIAMASPMAAWPREMTAAASPAANAAVLRRRAVTARPVRAAPATASMRKCSAIAACWCAAK